MNEETPYKPEGFIKVTRFEIIDHTMDLEEGGGRKVMVSPTDEGRDVHYAIQDDGRTLKVFITEKGKYA